MNDKLDPRAFADAFGEQGEVEPRNPSGRTVYEGVIVASRFNLKTEFEQMCRVIDAMPDITVLCLESIWCDSREGNSYAIGVKPHLFMPELRDVVAAAFLAAGGHNGISIYGAEGQFEDIDPDWPSDRAMVA
jgi:hypothetical protein